MRRVALVVCLCAAGALGGAAHAQPADWGVTRDPFDKTVVARWKAILAKNPYDRALDALVAIYRKSRSVDQLAQEYREEPDSWASLVVLARLAGTDTARALTAYKHAIELNPKDAHAWIAIGDASSKPVEARTAYERALAVAPEPLQKAVLRKLAELPGDSAARDRAYARLVELDPKNGKLWLDRADALARAGSFKEAIESYTTAEPLLESDPERRLYAIAQRGRARESFNEPKAAIADYNRAIAESPRGYYLRGELIGRIITIHAQAKTLPALVYEYEHTWPEKSRGHFEWATLGELYATTGARDTAIQAYQHAVAKDPTDLTTQRALVRLLDTAGRRDDATVQLAAAAKAAPRDAPIRFELVQRYWNTDKPKLFATLEELSRTQKNASVHHELADLYNKLRRIDLMTRELELVAKLEPTDDNLVALGEAYWVAGKDDQAITAWKKIARAGTAKADAALGAVLFDHELTEDALDAYGRALKREPNNPELWRARGAVFEAAERWTAAYSDTDHAVALLGPVSRDAGHATRYQLVRILATRDSDYVGSPDIADHVGDWEMRFSLKDDLIAGYLLAEFYGRQPDDRLAKILEHLHELVPQDHGVTLELVRAYRVTHEYDKAIATAGALRTADPTRNDELDAIVAQTKKDKEAFGLATAQDFEAGDSEVYTSERDPAAAADAVRSPVRAGIRLGIGKGLRGPANNCLTVGAVGTFGRGPIALVTRVDVAQRAGEMRSVTALAGSIGVTARALTTRGLAVQLGAAQRFEHSFDGMTTELGHDGLSVDATLDVVARNWPAGVGVRLEQGLYAHARDTSLLLEMSVELR